MKLKSITVYCGSAMGKNPAFAEAARDLGAELARRKIRLIYGAGSRGLMGVLADSALENGGEVVGVVPRQFVPEVIYSGLSDTIYTNSISERKRLMAKLGDAHIALAGGFGTLDEITDALQLLQLCETSTPCGFLNTANFYGRLFEFFDGALREGFLTKEHRQMAISADTPSALIEKLSAYDPNEYCPFWKSLE